MAYISPENGLKAWELYKQGMPTRDIAKELGLATESIRYGIKEIVDQARQDLQDEARNTFTKVDEILSDLLGRAYEDAKLGNVKAINLCLGLSKQLMDLYKLSPEQNIKNQTLVVLGTKSEQEILVEARRAGFKQIGNFLEDSSTKMVQLSE